MNIVINIHLHYGTRLIHNQIMITDMMMYAKYCCHMEDFQTMELCHLQTLLFWSYKHCFSLKSDHGHFKTILHSAPTSSKECTLKSLFQVDRT